MTVYRTKTPQPVDVADFDGLSMVKTRADSKEVEIVYDTDTKRLSIWSIPEDVTYATARRIQSLRI